VNRRTTKRLGLAKLAAGTVLVLLLGIFVSAGLADGGSAPSPTVATDQAAYVPGDTVNVTGAGWLPGETVHVHAAANSQPFSFDSDVLASADGSIDASFVLPSDYADTFAVAASGALQGSVSTSFSDAFAASGTAAPPTIVSDKSDYAPGSTVTLTGANWTAGESVHVVVNDTIGQTWQYTGVASADSVGAFTLQLQLPNYFVSDYDVIATGVAGEKATTTFTDGNATLHLSNAEGVANMSVTFDRWNGNATCTGTATLTNQTVTATSGGTVNIPGFGGNGDSVKLKSVSTTTSGKAFSGWTSGDKNTDSGTVIPGSPTPCISNGSGTNGNVTDAYAHFVTSVEATTLSVAAASGTFGGTTALSATLTQTSGGSAVSGKSISFTLNGNSAGSATTNGSGVATVAGVSLGGINAATYATGVGASFVGDSSFSASNGSNSLTVNKANQVITFTSSVPSAAVVGSTYQPQANGGGSGNPVTFAASGACSYNAGTQLVTMTSVGTCAVTADQLGSTNYSPAPQASQTFSVGKGNQTITVTTPAPATAAFNSQFTVAATASSGLAVVYSSAGSCSNSGATFTMTSGSGTCTVKFDQPGNANWNAAAQVTESVNASKLAQTITFGALADKTYGDSAFTVNATGGASGNPVTFATTGTCSSGGTNGVTITITGAGSCTVTASQAGNANYDAAVSVAQPFVIARRPLPIAADAKSKLYGAGNPAFTGSISGVQNSDAVTVGFASAADEATGIGTYAIVPHAEGTPAVLANYDVQPTNGTLTINKRPLPIAADAKSKLYGAGNPAFTGSISGVQNSDAVTVGFTSAADEATGIGTYAIVPHAEGTPAVLANYDVQPTNGTLTINPAPLSATADDKSKVYGDANPTLTGSLTGVKNGDLITLSLTTAADAGSGIGGYNIVPVINATAAVLANYQTPALTNGTLTITKAPLSASAVNKTKVYGDANPPLTGSVIGVKNSDPITLSFSTIATMSSGVGGYDIVPVINATPAVLANYQTPALTNGTLTITKAPLSASAANKSKILNAVNPTFTGTLTGVKNGDPITLTFTTTATQASPVGSYPIVPVINATLPVLANYQTPVLTNGTLTVSFQWDGFLQPINDTAHQIGLLESKFKTGQTIPAKFVLKNAAGTVVQQIGNPTFSRSGNMGACDSNATPDTTEVVTPDAGVVYTWDGSQYHYNWSTKGLNSGEYRIYANLADGSKPYVDICLS
jgi:MBG domain (YGX type)